MNDLEFKQYMRQMDDDLILHSILEANKITKQPIKIGDITIPADKETFNKMWLAKEFDKIEPSQHLKINPLSLLRTSLHMGRYEWDDYFFMERENLLFMTAQQLWNDSDYYATISINIVNILTISSKTKIKMQKGNQDITSYYLKCPPEEIMFPDVEDTPDNLSIKYSHPTLLKIFKEIVLRYQYLCNKSNDEMISIYMKEINELYRKIKFIQTLIYSDVNNVVKKFNLIKHNYLQVDPEIADISNEPDEFQDISYKEALYKFYIYCVSPEITSPMTLRKAIFLGNIVIQYEEFQKIIINYLFPLIYCIKQGKIKTIGSQMILEYLRPEYITDRFIAEKITNILQSI